MSDNIKVAIRVRPLITREVNEKLREQWEVQNNLIYPIDSSGKKNGESYVFDHIFHGNCSNEDIYNTVVHPVVDAAMNGFNGTIFAYGQTSSGKTYTMTGDENEPGLILIAVKNIFRAIQQAVDRKFLLRVSYMEIYNEKVYDLLDIKNSVTIHENTKGVVLNLKEEYTDCPEKVYMAMKTGDKARRIEETAMNEKSSRSHAIFRIIIESSDVKDDKGVVVNVAHLNLVDLAGSERAAQTKATGMRFKEGANINKSLSTLSLVMKQLSESQDFINFRDSKLTRILQPSLGGNALTAIICAVTPAALEETHSTLAFASRAKIVKNKPCLNEVLTDEAVIVRYALQIKKLKKDLEEAKDQAKFHEKLQEKIGRIEKYMIYSSKSTDKKKANTNRRQTWCAPRNRDDLPVIYETDILKNPHDALPTINDSTENLDKEVFPDGLFDFEIESRNLPCTQRKMHHTYSLTRSLSLSSKKEEVEEPTPEIVKMEEEEKTDEMGVESKEVVTWLVNETGTPKSVLRDRASYYNRELTALKEMTDKEKEILSTEHKKETEKLHSKIAQLENDLKYEKSIKTQLESEKKVLNTKNDELKKKNAELSRTNFQLQKEQNKSNDSEYMLEMMKEKFKKRENELLEQLTEARQNPSFSTYNTETITSESDVDTPSSTVLQLDAAIQSDTASQVDVATQSESGDSSQADVAVPSIDDPNDICNESVISSSSLFLPPELSIKFNEFKNKINLMKEELISFDYVGPDLIATFNELNQQSENLSNELSNYSENIQEEFLTLKSMVQSITYLFTFEKTIKNHELETTKYVNRIAHNQRKELTYEKLVKEQEDEIKHFSLKLLEYIQSEQELKNKLNIIEDDKKEIAKSHKIRIDALKKEYAEQINAKDKEIEDLSDKIMEYLDMITPLEEESKKYKELLEANANKEITEPDNNIINELNDKLTSCTAQISSLTEQLEKHQNELSTKNAAIEQLKAELEIKTQEVLTIHEKNEKVEQEANNNKEIEINTLKDTIQTLTIQLAEKSKTLSQLEKNTDILQSEIDNKNKEIADLLDEKLQLQNELTLKCEELKQSCIERDSLYFDLENKTAEFSDLSEKIPLIHVEHNNKIHELQQGIDKTNKQMTELKEELHNSIEEKRLNSKIQVLEETFDTLDIKLKEQTELIKQKNDIIECLKQNLNAEKIEIDVSEIENKDKIHEITKKSEILEEKVQNYEEQLASKDNKIQLYKNELCSKKNLIKQLSNEIELLNEKIITYESHIDALANQIEEQTNQMHKLQSDNVYANNSSLIINSEEKIMTPGKEKTIVNKSDLIEYENQIKNYKRLCKEQIAEVTSLKQRIDSYENKCEKFNATLNVIKNVMIAKFGDYIKTNEDNKIVTQLIHETSKNIETLKTQITEKTESSPEILQELITNYNEKLEYFKLNENEFEANKLLLAEKQNDAAELSTKLSKLNQKLEICKDEIVTLTNKKESLEQQINKYQQREIEFNSINLNFEEQNVEINTLSTKLTDAENQLQLYEASMGNLKSNIQLYKNQIDEYQKSESEYENMVRERDAKKEILNQKLMEYQEQQKHMVNNIESLKEQIISKTNELEKFLQQETNLVSNKQLIEERDQEITILCEEMMKCEQQLNHYDLDVKILTNILNSASIFLNELTNKKTLLNGKIESLQNILEQHTQEIDELKDKSTSFKNEIQDLIKEKNELNDEKDREIDTLKEALNEKINKYEECMHEITDLKNKINKLNNKVKDLTKENINLITQKDIEIKALKEVFNNEKQKYEHQIDQLNIIQEEFKAIKSQNFDEKNNSLNLQVKQLQEQMKEKDLYEKELEEKIQYIENLGIEIDIIKSDCLKNEILNKEYSSSIQRLTKELNKTKFELSVLKDSYIDKEKEIEAIKQSLENKELEINKINEELKEKNNELTILKNEISESNVKKDETEFKHNKEMQEKVNEIEKLNDKLRSLEKFVKEFCKNLNAQMPKIEKSKQLIESVNTYSKKIENCNKAINLVRSQIDTTKSSLKNKEEQLKIVLDKILNHMKPRCEISTDVDIETFRAQCNVAFSTNEVKKLRLENTEYKALVAKIRSKANSQIGNLQNFLTNVQSENEKLKISESTNAALIKSLEEKVRNLQTEINKTSDGNSIFVALQTEIANLKEENQELKNMGHYLQEQTTKKISELKEYKKKLEFLKNENSELLKASSDYVQLKKKLAATEASLKTAQSSIKQLEMEKDNFNATSRSLEETLEDVKFELYSLKNKERELVKKHKRRSLHDSSRVLSEVDEPATSEQLEDASKQNKENAQINTECERCKKCDIECQTEEHNTEIRELKDEIKKWKNKYSICKNLCMIRKRKIDQLEVEKRKE